MKISATLIIVCCLLTLTVLGQTTTWYKYSENPVLRPGPSGSWDAAAVVLGSVLKMDGIYHMWYQGCDNMSAAMNDNWKVGYATSLDGMIWDKSASNPVFEPNVSGWDNTCIWYPVVLHDGSQFHMWYGSGGTILNPGDIGYAISSDGIVWTRQNDGNPVMEGLTNWESGGITPTYIEYSETAATWTYRMWYTGGVSGAGGGSIGLATSQDGLAWIRQNAGNAVLEPGGSSDWDELQVYEASAFQNADGGFEMWYTGERNPNMRIGYASSSDGLVWTKHTDNPILRSDMQTYESLWQARPWVLQTHSNEYEMWYCGATDGAQFDFQIGYARTESFTINIDQSSIYPVTFSLSQNYPNPFNPATTISYSLTELSDVKLTICDVTAKEVIILENQEQPAGHYEVQWDGVDESGNPVSTGVYFARLQAGKYNKTIKMIYLR